MRLDRSDLELEVLFRRMEAGEIDLQPDFQRGEVWNEERQRRLIDTILRGWYVPAIHLISEPDTSRDLVLDGQQRLAAIRLFFGDRLSVDGFLSPRDETLEGLHGLLYSSLPDEAQRRVRRFPLTVVTLTDHEPEEPYELFFRLNQHMALTPSEKRNALYGRARDQVKEVVSLLVKKQLLAREVIGFANSRLAYDDVFARFALALEFGTLRQSYSNKALEEFYRERQFSPEVLHHVGRSGEHFLTAARQVRARLNKATLFSWLVFTYALLSLGERVDPEFLGEFEELRRMARHSARAVPTELRPVITTYNDRASYRVNDTLSILLRDLGLHTAFAAMRSDRRGVSALLSVLPGAEDDAEAALISFLEETGWDLPT